MYKLMRIFAGGYTPDQQKLDQKNVLGLTKPFKKFYSVANSNQGFGQIKGVVKKIGANYPEVSVCVFKRDTRQLLWEIKSKSDGGYEFRNLAIGLECFVIAFDPNNQYNAVIQDKVVAK